MEGKAPQSGTVSGPAASKREVRRMIRERIGGLDAASREATSRSICRRVAALVREKNFRRVAVFAARPGKWICCPCWTCCRTGKWYFPLVHEGRMLSFHRVCHHGEFVTGCWDIREPGPGCPELHAGEMDLIVLPEPRLRGTASGWGTAADFMIRCWRDRLREFPWRESASPASFWTTCPWKPMTGMWTW